jgi:hypothetical protein
MAQLQIWPEGISEQDGLVTTTFVLEDALGTRTRSWYRLPARLRPAITESCDPFVLAALFTAMQMPANLHVHGTVSPSLLKNLEEYQAMWHVWLPERYQPVEILADSEQETCCVAGSPAIMAFSGGLDSSFTAWRHRTGRAGRQTEDLQAGLVLHGFDLPLNREDAFAIAFERARLMLDSLGIETIPMTNNLRGLGGIFADCHAAILASCLALLQKRFSVGLIADSSPYEVLVFPWAFPFGSSSLSDRYLSSNAFTITVDGAGYYRFDKAQALAQWPEALSNIRVCLGHNPLARARNCCTCEKCIRNILIFRVLGLGLPACFERDVSDRQILRLSYKTPQRFANYSRILQEAHRRGIRASWVRTLRLSILWNRLLLPFRRSEYFHQLVSRLK